MLGQTQTLTTRSQPQETMIGLETSGENRTQLIHSEWLFSAMVTLHSPRVFHNLMDLSREAETICLLSAEKATERTSFSCPTKVLVVAPVFKSQRRRVRSKQPEFSTKFRGQKLLFKTYPRSRTKRKHHRRREQHPQRSESV